MRASGPPFTGTEPMCKCGWKWASDCKSRSEHCGLVLGMPKTEEPLIVHTPYEFLPEEPVDLDKVCREVVEDLVKDSKSTQVGGTHYAEMSVQPWTAMQAWMSPDEYVGYHVGTVLGYLSRHKKKGGLTDIKKAKHHLEELIRYFEEDEEYPW